MAKARPGRIFGIVEVVSASSLFILLIIKCTKGSTLSDLKEQNRLLKLQMRELVSKAQDNQAILERYQQFELSLLSAKNIGELLDSLLNTSIKHFDLSDCRLIWFEHLQPFKTFIDHEPTKKFGDRLVFSAMSRDVEAHFNDSFKPILRALSPAEKLHWFPGETRVESAAFLPLICDDQLMGCFNLGSQDKNRFTPDKAVDFIAHMGMIAATCIQNTVIKEQMRMMSLVDMLTQVKNRRSFDSDISKEVSRSQRNQQPLSCLFIDADHFKNVNDTYGHQVGDITLKSLAAWVKGQLREGDHIARYGGEEFAILLPNCNENLAFNVAERIRHFVSQQWVRGHGVEFQITLSIGVSTFTPASFEGISKDDVITYLVAQADAAVYDAKQAGRNRVCARNSTPDNQHGNSSQTGN